MIGNGDVLHFTDFERRLDEGGFDAVMIGRCERAYVESLVSVVFLLLV